MTTPWKYSEEIVEAFKAAHREGQAADELSRQMRNFEWDIEGWDGETLLLYIAGSGLHKIPASEVGRLGHAFLTELELFERGDGDERSNR